MRRVKSRDTGAEMIVRRLLHRLGYRYRLHRKDLPGSPDIVFPGRKALIFVHGCFWHQHPGCRAADRPASRTDYWNPKLDRNVARDSRNREALEATEWRVLTVWECDLKDRLQLELELIAFLGPAGHK